jgi:regulator of RNase E activity RraA
MSKLEHDFLDSLRRFDTAAVANGVEELGVWPRNSGYTEARLRCLSAARQPMVGYALTVKVDSTSATGGSDHIAGFDSLAEAIRTHRGPVVLVYEEVGPDVLRGCHAGGVVGAVLASNGGVGMVTNAGFRDLAELAQLELHVFGAGTVVSHGSHTIREVGGRVEVARSMIEDGDLLHGNEDGILKVPSNDRGRLLELIEKQLMVEHEILTRFLVPS